MVVKNLNNKSSIYKILIVDDSELQRELLKSSLTKAFNFVFYEANNGKEAFKILEKNKKIECIILDLVMPVMDGWQFLEEFNKRKLKIPIIVNSSLDDISNIIKALKKGCFDYFTKPLKKEDLNVFIPLKIKNAINNFRLQNFYKFKTIQFKKELKLAKKFQTSLLPQYIDTTDFQIEYLYKPFYYVGGDFIDYIVIDNYLYFFIADISGHGIASSMISSLLKYEFERFFISNKSIKDFVSFLNSNLINIFTEGMFLTGIIIKIDLKNKIMEHINCAHPESIIYRKNTSKIFELKTTTSILGVFEETDISSQKTQLYDNDLIFLYTDGIYEFITNNNNIFGIDNLKTVFKIFIEKKLNRNEETTKFLLTSFYNFINTNYVKKIEDDILIGYINIKNRTN